MDFENLQKIDNKSWKCSKIALKTSNFSQNFCKTEKQSKLLLFRVENHGSRTHCRAKRTPALKSQYTYKVNSAWFSAMFELML